MTPTIGIVMGDRNGIGPEVTLDALAAMDNPKARFVVIGDARVLDRAETLAGTQLSTRQIGDLSEFSQGSEEPILLLHRPWHAQDWPTPKADKDAGAEVLDTLAFACRLAVRGRIDGLVYAPLNKLSMKLAGLQAVDEADFLANEMDSLASVRGELNVIGDTWIARVTSHVPISDVAPLVTRAAVEKTIGLLVETMQRAGFENPSIAVSGLNPHAGDGGLFGKEEIREIAPAIDAMRARWITVSGPHAPDTVFPFLEKLSADGVVCMYHDQAQIALKLLGARDGVTALSGLPVPVCTPAHGTAFDIAWKGQARSASMANAIDLCTRLAHRARF